MLVLSRRPNESIEFPTLGVTINIIRVNGKTIRMGVKAPSTVPVIRSELKGLTHSRQQSEPGRLDRQVPAKSDSGLSHSLRGQLNSATVALYVAQKQLEIGRTGEAESSLRFAIQMFENLESEARSERAGLPTTSDCRRDTNSALVIEDNLNESNLLVSYLQLNGWKVDAVSDGRSALAYLSEQPCPDCLLLDMHVPVFDGPTILTEVQRDERLQGLKVFVVSGSHSNEFNFSTGQGRLSGWFTKPLNPPLIVEAMNVAVAAPA